MTYAGIKSLIYCGVGEGRPAHQEGRRVDQEELHASTRTPACPSVRGQWGLYYYYHTMAKCLDALGVDYVVDAEGKKHDWRKPTSPRRWPSGSRPDGSWVNDSDHWMEGDPNLVTGYALMALSYCRPKK